MWKSGRRSAHHLELLLVEPPPEFLQHADGARREAPLELPDAQQHVETVAGEGDAHPTVVFGIGGCLDQPLRLETLDERGGGGARDAQLAGDVAGAGAIGTALVHGGDHRVRPVRQTVARNARSPARWIAWWVAATASVSWSE